MSASSSRTAKITGVAVVLAAVIGIGIFSGTAADRSPEPAAAPVATAPSPAPSVPEPGPAQSECRYDPEKSPVANFGQLVSFTDAMIGNPNAEVTVVEYFDPNCGHCRSLHPIMMEVAEKYKDRARFVFKPFPLRPSEAPWLMQTEALHAAGQEGKFFEMMEAQMSRQHLVNNSGLPLNALRASAEEAGMDADAMMRKIQSGVYRRHVEEEYKKALEAGLTGTPMLIINGNVVTAASRTPACLGKLIEDEAKG